MLPFLKVRPSSGHTVQQRTPDEPTPQDSPDAAMEACANDLIEAIHSKNVKATTAALKAAFEVYETSPSEEYPTQEENE